MKSEQSNVQIYLLAINCHCTYILSYCVMWDVYTYSYSRSYLDLYQDPGLWDFKGWEIPKIILRSSKTDFFLFEGLPLLLQIDSYLENQLLNESGVVGPKLVNRGYCHLKTIKNSRITRGSLQRYRNQSITNNINFLLPGTARDSSRNCFYCS